MVMGRDGNNQMFPIAWVVVHTESIETWSWFIDQLSVDLNIGEGLGWSVMSDMQKVSFVYIYLNIVLVNVTYKYLVEYLLKFFIFV